MNLSSRPEWVPINLLLPADSPRQDGEDAEHTRMLATVDGGLPPIIVDRATMRVVDGMHRLGAARLRGDDKIEVYFFDGTERDAFVLAVETNIAHGLPLSRADRMRAAERIIASHPAWSDRTIAAATGLGATTISNIRRRISTDTGDCDGTRARVGRDGRVRPLNHAEGRIRAFEIIQNQPTASIRQIAKIAGVSASTVRDVRMRIERGEDPVPRVRAPAQRRMQASVAVRDHDGATVALSLVSLLDGLRSDPTLRLSEPGRLLLRWLSFHAIHSREWHEAADKVPPHCVYVMVELARQCAWEWQRIASDLDQRSGVATASGSTGGGGEPNPFPHAVSAPSVRRGDDAAHAAGDAHPRQRGES